MSNNKKETQGTVRCNKCGKVAPIDKKASNKNWVAYDTSKPCECGGKFVLDVKAIEKRGKGRPRKEKTEPTKKEIAKDYNNEIIKANEQLEVIAQKFVDNPQSFFAEREEEIAKIIEKYGNLASEDLENGIITKKDYSTRLVKCLTKPLIPSFGVTAKHTAHSLQMVNDWYWENVVLKANETTQFIPSIYHICKLLNISKSTLYKYASNGDEQMREVCEMIKDEFVDYYQQKGLTKELNDVMAMFVLKTSYGQRENDQPQIAVVNVNNSPDEKISKYARQHGFEVWHEEN